MQEVIIVIDEMDSGIKHSCCMPVWFRSAHRTSQLKHTSVAALVQQKTNIWQSMVVASPVKLPPPPLPLRNTCRSLRAFHQYVPIFKTSEHDLMPRIEWAFQHEELSRHIVFNANRFALTYTTYKARVRTCS
jgi:hypothetical protein